MIEYLNNSVWATLKPCTYGIGVFAIRDIPKGTLLSDHSSRNPNPVLYRVSKEDFTKILPEIRELILDRTIFMKGKPIIFPSPNSNQTLQAFMNHSDTPNSDGQRALVDIKKGEEVTENYKSFYDLHELSKSHYSWL